MVGLGGVFLLKEGKVKHHVMPDFSSRALCSDSDVDDWLHFFEMKAPIVHLGTLVTGDLVSCLNYLLESAFTAQKSILTKKRTELLLLPLCSMHSDYY